MNTMTFSMEQSTAPICPISPGGESHHSDHHSDITTTTQDDENFIALLQYRDAYHILNLTPPSSQANPVPPERIQAAYDSARDQVLMTLEQSSVAVGGGRNMFAISQQNYLELKLQALDQAYEELMPDAQIIRRAVSNDQGKNAGISDEGDVAASAAPAPVHAPSKNTAALNSPDDHVRTTPNAGIVRTVKTKQADGEVQTIQKDPSEDELDTIDIYFRPNPTSTKRSPNAQQISDHQQQPSDSSIASWGDGSSIFSIISKTKQNIEESSVGSFTDMFGPILSTPGENKSVGEEKSASESAGKHRQQKRRESSSKASQSSKESKQSSYTNRRPPSGINVKNHARPKAQISPTSITDFPKGIHNDNHYDNTSNFSPGKATTIMGRGRMMQRSRNVVHAARQNSHEATEAARQGILRALSEENSECLPLDDDYQQDYLNVSNETQGVSEDAKFRPRDSPISEHNHNNNGRRTEPKHFFHGRSDPMPKETNSLMDSVLNDRQTQNSQTGSGRSSPSVGTHDRGGVVTPSPKNKTISTKLRSSSISSENSSKHNKSKARTSRAIAEPQRSDETYAGDSLLQSEDCTYDAIIQSGMELADELCSALNHCWGSSGELAQTFSRASSAASAALDAAASEFDRPHNNNNDSSRRSSRSKSDVNEEESTSYTRSSLDEDESTYINNQSVFTDGESTAFNTMSSFSRRSSSDSPNNLNKDKKQLKLVRSSSTADPPPRMLV